jgi:hypothetical protein
LTATAAAFVAGLANQNISENYGKATISIQTYEETFYSLSPFHNNSKKIGIRDIKLGLSAEWKVPNIQVRARVVRIHEQCQALRDVFGICLKSTGSHSVLEVGGNKCDYVQLTNDGFCLDDSRTICLVRMILLSKILCCYRFVVPFVS